MATQDGGIGRYTVPPCTTKRRTTTNFETENNQNYQKIELYGSPTTKELKKRHSSRLVGVAETNSWVREDSQQGGSLRTRAGNATVWPSRWSYICEQKKQEEQLGSETDHATQGSRAGK